MKRITMETGKQFYVAEMDQPLPPLNLPHLSVLAACEYAEGTIDEGTGMDRTCRTIRWPMPDYRVDNPRKLLEQGDVIRVWLRPDSIAYVEDHKDTR